MPPIPFPSTLPPPPCPPPSTFLFLPPAPTPLKISCSTVVQDHLFGSSKPPTREASGPPPPLASPHCLSSPTHPPPMSAQDPLLGRSKPPTRAHPPLRSALLPALHRRRHHHGPDPLQAWLPGARHGRARHVLAGSSSFYLVNGFEAILVHDPFAIQVVGRVWESLSSPSISPHVQHLPPRRGHRRHRGLSLPGDPLLSDPPIQAIPATGRQWPSPPLLPRVVHLLGELPHLLPCSH